MDNFILSASNPSCCSPLLFAPFVGPTVSVVILSVADIGWVGTGWANCEYRTCKFANSDPDDDKLIEVPESKQRRRKDKKPLDRDEIRNVEETTDGEMKEATD